MSSSVITTRMYLTPCGNLLLGSVADRLCLCDWTESKHHSRIMNRLQHTLNAPFIKGNTSVLQQAIEELNAYFAGKHAPFQTPLLFIGTEFQQRVRSQLLHIPYGNTLSYGSLALSLGVPGAARAVANAVGANALSLFVPCHRVISSQGDTGGYAGGRDAKRYLLTLEQQYTQQAHFSPLFT